MEPEGYQWLDCIQNGPDGRIDRLVRVADGSRWIRRCYYDDKRELFNVLAAVQSPHLARVDWVGFGDGQTVVLEAELPGVPLGVWLAGKPISQKQAVALAQQLLEVLVCLQKQAVIHRDVKPDNILVTTEGELYLIDFGAARIYRPGLSGDTTLLGTQGYAAPEQYGFAPTDLRTDLFGAGVVLDQIFDTAGLPPKGALRKFSQRCAAFDPARRFTSASHALRAFQQVRWRPLALGVAAAVLLVLVGALVGSAVLGRVPNTVLPEHIPDELAQSKAGMQSEEQVPSQGEAPGVSSVSGSSAGTAAQAADIEMYPIIQTRLAAVRSAIPGDVPGRYQLELGEGLPFLTLDANIRGETLTLRFQGEEGEQSFTLHNDNPPPGKDYEGTHLEGEVLLYDLDGDGACEVLVALADRNVNYDTASSDKGIKPATNTNWMALWCFGYMPGEGVWQAEGVVATAYPWERILVDSMESGEIYLDESWEYCLLEGRKLVFYQV